MIRFFNILMILMISIIFSPMFCAHAGQSPPKKEITEQTFVYQCVDHPTFTVRIEENIAWLFLPSGTIKFSQVPAVSGAKYQQGANLFWSKGQNAILKVAGSPRIDCQNNPNLAIWEDAKFRGVDFRAVGNEPGWSLEMKTETLIFTTNYGHQSRVYTSPAAITNHKERTTTFNAHSNSNKISILLKGGPCSDSMSDESFETTVEVVTEEGQYFGCGKALH